MTRPFIRPLILALALAAGCVEQATDSRRADTRLPVMLVQLADIEATEQERAFLRDWYAKEVANHTFFGAFAVHWPSRGKEGWFGVSSFHSYDLAQKVALAGCTARAGGKPGCIVAAGIEPADPADAEQARQLGLNGIALRQYREMQEVVEERGGFGAMATYGMVFNSASVRPTMEAAEAEVLRRCEAALASLDQETLNRMKSAGIAYSEIDCRIAARVVPG